jgi:hypothetical protein
MGMVQQLHVAYVKSGQVSRAQYLRNKRIIEEHENLENCIANYMAQLNFTSSIS